MGISTGMIFPAINTLKVISIRLASGSEDNGNGIAQQLFPRLQEIHIANFNKTIFPNILNGLCQ